MPGTPGPGVAPPAGVPISAILSTALAHVHTHSTLQCRRFAHAWSKYCMRALQRVHIEFAASKKVKRRTDNLGFVADYSGLGQLDSLVSGILLVYRYYECKPRAVAGVRTAVLRCIHPLLGKIRARFCMSDWPVYKTRAGVYPSSTDSFSCKLLTTVLHVPCNTMVSNLLCFCRYTGHRCWYSR